MSEINSSSEDEGLFTVYDTDRIIGKLRRKIIEPLSPYSYVKVCVNIMWLVQNEYYDNREQQERLNLAHLVLDSIPELRQLRDYHYSVLESLYNLAENDKLRYCKKRISWFQYFYSFIF